MSQFARSVDTPLFNCAAILGDKTLKISSGYVTDFSINYPWYESSVCGSYPIRHPIGFGEVTIKLQCPDGGISYEETTEQRIRNKRVDDCTIDELLFAIQHKIKYPKSV